MSVYLPDPVRDSLVCGWSGIENRSVRFAISCYSKVDVKYQKMVSQKVSIIFPHLIARDSKGKLGYNERT